MNLKLVNAITQFTPSKLWSCLVLLTILLVIAFVAIGWVNFRFHGQMGVVSAGVAVVICWLSAVIALTISAVMRGPQNAIQGVLLGMIFRMGLPMAAGLILSINVPPLAKAGVFEMILVFYLITLVVETILSLGLVHTPKDAAKAAS